MIDTEIVEVAYETDASGAFAFSTPQCSLTVEKTAGVPLGPVSDDDWFFGCVLRGVADPTLFAVWFWDSTYGEQVSELQALPVDKVFTMGWQTGAVTVLQDGTPVASGAWADDSIGASGAGTSACDGIYEPNGTYGGKTLYTKVDSLYEIWWDGTSGTWVLSAAAGTLPPLYAQNAVADPPLTSGGDWSPVTGESPAPTVVLAPADGGTIDIVLVRVYPETQATLDEPLARNLQLYLPPNSDDFDGSGNHTYVTDDDAIIRWKHPEEGLILPRFAKGHGALGQRLTDHNPFTGEDPTEYTEEVRAYYKGCYTVLQEGVDKTWDIPGGTLTITVPTGHAALVRPQNWLQAGAWVGGGGTGQIDGPATVTMRALPVGMPFNITWFRVTTFIPFAPWDYNYQARQECFAVVEGAATHTLGTCDTPYAGQGDGFIFKAPGEPLAGVAIYGMDATDMAFEQLATTDATGYWSISGIDFDGGHGPDYLWLYDASWGTCALGLPFSSTWAVVGSRVMSGYWGAWSDSETDGEAYPDRVFTLPHLTYTQGAVTVQRMDGATVVDTWDTKEGDWGGWQTKEIIPAVKFQTITYGQAYPGTTYYGFRYISAGSTPSSLANTGWEQPWNTLHPSGQGYASGCFRVDSLGGIIGGKVAGNLLREDARTPIADDLEEARREGMEHGLHQPPMRTEWLPEENDDNQYAASAIGRECPLCHGQALIEPGIGPVTGLPRGYCWRLHTDENCGGVPVAVDARTYLESFPVGNVSGHYHLLYGPLGLRRYHGKSRTEPLGFWYRPDDYKEFNDYLACWLTADAGLLRWVAVHRSMGSFIGGDFFPGATSATVLAAYSQTGTCGLRPKLYPLGKSWLAEASYEVDVLHLDGSTQTLTASVTNAGGHELDPVFLLPRHFTKAESRGWRAAGLVDAVTGIRQVSGGSNSFQAVIDPPVVLNAGIPIVNQQRTPYVLPWLPLGGGVKVAVDLDTSIWVVYNDSENIAVRHMRAPWTDYSAAITVADGVEYEVADIACRPDGWKVVHVVRNSDGRLCSWRSLDGVTWTATGPL